VVTRRALLLAGGATLLAAGCGKDDEPESPAVSATSAMLRELAAERALAGDLQGADGLAGRIGDRAAARATRLAAAISSAGGRPHEAGEPSGDLSLASRHAREALEAHVAALPSLTGSLRKMGADLVAESAADAGLLGATSGTAFPGTPA
jgi:hypothetical protein